jgi:pyruvate/2-oxoglutarate dehydrogenase complex dihydrolipoamide dehydrogenase (E3) component
VTTAQQTYDVVVLGVGSTPENVADIAGRGGLSAVLVESELVGGECPCWACMPSQTLLRGSEAIAQARAVRGASAAATVEQDIAAGQVQWVDGAGLGLVREHGRLAGEKRVVVTPPDGAEVVLVARHAVAVCTGSRAADPQVAAVGLTSAQAAERGLPHRVVEYPIGSVAGATVVAEGYSGTAIAVVDTEREVLLGVTFVGPGVAELLHSATIAVVGEVPISRLWHAGPSYPAISEVWLRLLETFRG